MTNYFGEDSKKGKVIWLFGRPCAGKTTIGNQLAIILKEMEYSVITLDGDELRETINRDLGFSPEDRTENIRRSAELARILAKKGFIIICSFVTPTNKLRDLIRERLLDVPFDLIYINTTLSECIRRDVKGHYRQAHSGTISNFTGIGSPFEEPANTDLVINTINLSISESVKRCLDFSLIAFLDPFELAK